MENITLTLTPSKAALLLLALDVYDSEIGLGRNADSLALADEIRAKLPPNPSPETEDLARNVLRGEEFDRANDRAMREEIYAKELSRAHDMLAEMQAERED